MSKRHDLQDATGRIEYYAGRGTIQAWGPGTNTAGTGTPTNATAGFAPGCIWHDLVNGNLYLNVGTFSAAVWVKLNGGAVSTNTAASTAVSASATETLFSTSYTVPANMLRAGSLIKINYQGTATATNAADTLQIKLYIGGLSGTALQTSSATDAADNDMFAGTENIIIRTAGASGTLVASGSFTKVEAATAVATRVDVFTASTAVDTTAAQVLGVSATWSSTNAGNSCRLDMFAVEIYP